MNGQMIIGLSGFAGNGKTSVASLLIQNNGFKQLSFADPIRAMMVALGVPMETLRDTAAKEQPHPALCGRTPREAMETLGTAWGRDMVHPKLWLNQFALRAAQCPFVICDDVRFQNEADAIKDAGGKVFRLIVPGREPRLKTDHAVAALEGVEDIVNVIGVTRIKHIYNFVYGKSFGSIDSAVPFDEWVGTGKGALGG